MSTQNIKTAIITGSAQRIGAAIARQLHQQDYNLLLHYRNSEKAATLLSKELNSKRPQSVIIKQLDLLDITKISVLVENVINTWGKLNTLINNASSFYPTPVGTITENNWHELLGSNLKAPLFLSQAAAPYLAESSGCIVNIIDIHAERPMRRHTVYSVAKAGLAALTKSLAKELAPNVRVNGVSPGAILWPEKEMSDETKNNILDRIPLSKPGNPENIAAATAFLIDSSYITGHIIEVDGGRHLYM